MTASVPNYNTFEVEYNTDEVMILKSKMGFSYRLEAFVYVCSKFKIYQKIQFDTLRESNLLEIKLGCS